LDKEKYFREILENNKDRIYRICCYYVSGYDDRQDLYQEVLINVWKALDRFKGNSNISTYIYRIAVNTSLRSILNIKKKVKTETDLKSNEKSIIESDSGDEKIQLEKNISKLLLSINKLPVNDKTIMSLLLEDFSYQQIADITGIEKNYVGVKINRIKKVLRKIIKESQNGN